MLRKLRLPEQKRSPLISKKATANSQEFDTPYIAVGHRMLTIEKQSSEGLSEIRFSCDTTGVNKILLILN
ncbi:MULTISPECIES: hypothetical protein [Nostoc]|uniref:Uncharacterized protein n=1 Tax=Nostoc paludosum FACHB-159 TaxID=2692908 RepID=A0ABR8KFX6_9NOSO|nr:MULTISPECIES: hypothetical protein [Nostoc]MBD2681490.1 hypothetical protein [Nostoc sp. FACHB-857]MBD2737950.1 hypothetical protein [Nostoc paludosum FACHB-159]